MIILGCALPVVCAAAVLEPGGVRNICRLALGVVQVRLAWIGTDRSLTFRLNVLEMVPAASTWPAEVSVTGAAEELATETSAITHASATARKMVRRLEPCLINADPFVRFEYACGRRG